MKACRCGPRPHDPLNGPGHNEVTSHFHPGSYVPALNPARDSKVLRCFIPRDISSARRRPTFSGLGTPVQTRPTGFSARGRLQVSCLMYLGSLHFPNGGQIPGGGKRNLETRPPKNPAGGGRI